MKNNNNKLNWASLFTNKNGGKPLYKNGEPILDKEGLNVLAPNFQCILNLKEPLPTGEYIIKFKEKLSQSGKLYYGGAVKIKDQENYKPNQHQEAKQNGYQPDMKGLVKPVIEDQEIIDDDPPF
jgi:hypothetical protein